ncbi:MAG: hypothetical protein B7Y25_08245 [Alphaproteobacteria bacterium 16-39-46]|nr:MAG: hypothetical protein B7Y25_08245 [Alphaproteobacteria bacterium 16-39-46]OZA41170.1 MAG: hypothetical protein B7X84_08465 [Alphaproteobacteria bacterium 17-39-52]HQS84877.1 hypothetical protein [Alphaproteobacteria bacterium]HQS94651.1 hypothetical protein [Alphaproteobacteria bacterium]
MKIFQKLNLKKLAQFGVVSLIALSSSISYAMEQSFDVDAGSQKIGRIQYNVKNEEVLLDLPCNPTGTSSLNIPKKGEISFLPNSEVVTLSFDPSSLYSFSSRISQESFSKSIDEEFSTPEISDLIRKSVKEYQENLAKDEFLKEGVALKFVTPERVKALLKAYQKNQPVYARLVVKFAKDDEDVPGSEDRYFLESVQHVRVLQDFIKAAYDEEGEEAEKYLTPSSITAWIFSHRYGSDSDDYEIINLPQAAGFHLSKIKYPADSTSIKKMADSPSVHAVCALLDPFYPKLEKSLREDLGIFFNAKTNYEILPERRASTEMLHLTYITSELIDAFLKAKDADKGAVVLLAHFGESITEENVQRAHILNYARLYSNSLTWNNLLEYEKSVEIDFKSSDSRDHTYYWSYAYKFLESLRPNLKDKI